MNPSKHCNFCAKIKSDSVELSPRVFGREESFYVESVVFNILLRFGFIKNSEVIANA